MIICIDPGHGYRNGRATGARGCGITEDDWAIDFAKRLAHYLRARGAGVYVTRGSGIVGISERARRAIKYGADALVSIHLNAASTADANGCEAFVAPNDERSRKLADAILEPIAKLGMRNRGTKPDNKSQHGRLGILRGTYEAMPAALIEVGFLTNEADAQRLKSPRWCEDAACEVAKAIVETMRGKL